ncbi:MAG: acyl-CoA thioesterase [Deltaproteobacteria bacterium]|nr:acyl-CoA thioesterase [Deltaproteobacteria bacterium]
MSTIKAPNGQDGEPIIRAMMMPRDTNYHGTIFGGIILSLIDQAAGTVASVRARSGVVTLKMNEVIFHNPVFVGDLVSVYANLMGVGRTSMKIQAEVWAHRRDGGDPVHVTSAELIFVAVGPDRRPIPVPAE